jgi:hypothetical protein
VRLEGIKALLAKNLLVAGLLDRDLHGVAVVVLLLLVVLVGGRGRGHVGTRGLPLASVPSLGLGLGRLIGRRRHGLDLVGLEALVVALPEDREEHGIEGVELVRVEHEHRPRCRIEAASRYRIDDR